MMNPLNDLVFSKILETGKKDMVESMNKIQAIIDKAMLKPGQNDIVIPSEMLYVYYEEYKSLEKLVDLATSVFLITLNDFKAQHEENDAADSLIDIIKSFEGLIKFTGHHFKKFGDAVIPTIHARVFRK